MEFFLKIKNTIHGWSGETRTFLAMATMGIGIVVFFSVWISSVSSGLVSLAPPTLSAPTASAPPAEVLPSSYPMAFRPPSPTNSAGDVPPSVAPLATGAASAPTPMQGVAETFGGVRQLFRTTDSSDTDTIESRARAAGAWLWRMGTNLIVWAQNFLVWLGGALYQRVSTLIAS